MVDIVGPDVRSRMMSRIRGKNTQPEMVVRRILFGAGYRYRLHRKDLPGVPDIVMSGLRVVIFVHGCFWHMHRDCALSKLPGTRQEFWKRKLEGNVERDRRNVQRLLDEGWRVVVVWECATRHEDPDGRLAEALLGWVRGCATYGEISGGA